LLNGKFFFDTARLRLFDGKLKATQVAGLSAILDEWEEHHAGKDDRWLAYVLATVHHETDRTMQPIKEYGGQSYFSSGCMIRKVSGRTSPAGWATPSRAMAPASVAAATSS
jgi:hypothetical protein